MENNNLVCKLLNTGYDSKHSNNSLITPIFRTSNFEFTSANDGEKSFELAYHLREKDENETPQFIYSRVNNPNMEIVESKLSVLHNTEKSCIFSSGMSAISTSCLTFLKANDTILYTTPIYGGTNFLFENILPKYNITCCPFNYDITDEEFLYKLKHYKNIKMIFIETPCNPLLQLISIKKIKELIHMNYITKDIIIVVDNTMISPIDFSPIKQGADLVVYSITKFIGGHSDLIAGGVSGNHKLINNIKVFRTIMGNILDSESCWLIQRSLATLSIRTKQQNKSTKIILEFLKKNDKIIKIYHPGFNNKEQETILKDEYYNSGSIISFEINYTKEEIFKSLDKLKIIKLAVSLGSVETLIQHPYSMTHRELSESKKNKLNINAQLLRLSIGLEEEECIIEDLKQAFDL
jgi:methionine-gamma-lyase